NLVRANLVGPIQYSDPKSNPDATYFGSSAFNIIGLACGSAAVPAGAGTYGTTPRNVLRGPGRVNADFALSKTTAIAGERLKLTLRAELFNIFNNVEFRDPNTTFTGSSITGLNTNPNFGKISTTYDPRIAQFAVRLSF